MELIVASRMRALREICVRVRDWDQGLLCMGFFFCSIPVKWG